MYTKKQQVPLYHGLRKERYDERRMVMLGIGIKAMEKGLLPDWMLRQGIRWNVKARYEEFADDIENAHERLEQFVSELSSSPVAIDTQKANEQHYEVPARFFELCLGKHLKYSSCYWSPMTKNLDAAEEEMLSITCERAGLVDGESILELGCGWGSLTLFMAEKFPHANITGVSNSHSQREFILSAAKERGLSNIEIITCDMNSFNPPDKYHRIVSVEMFEHMRNYQNLLRRIASWLHPDGSLFIHIFCHTQFAYPYETDGDHNWMGRYFFTGGVMPSKDLLLRFDAPLQINKQWMISGMHYAKTAEAWLDNMDKNKDEILRVFRPVYGEESLAWFYRWRAFFLACAEMFAYKKGQEWMVTHMQFSKQVQ